jgi:hypothetical protein
MGDAKSFLGDAKSSLGDAKSSLGDAESSLGDAKSSLGDAKSSLGVHKQGFGTHLEQLEEPVLALAVSVQQPRAQHVRPQPATSLIQRAISSSRDWSVRVSFR